MIFHCKIGFNMPNPRIKSNGKQCGLASHADLRETKTVIFVPTKLSYIPMTKTIKTPYRNILTLVAALPMLAACSYFDVPDLPRISLLSSPTPSGEGVETIEQVVPGTTPAQASANAREVVLNATEGRVRIFSLTGDDQPAIPASSYNGAREIAPLPVAPISGGSRSGSKNVEIFSLDGGYDAPSITPAPHAYNDLRAPVGYTGEKVVLYFEHDSSSLDQNDLAQIATIAKGYNGRTLNVEGHASITANYKDARQKEIVNLKVSMDRAFAVSQALIQRGVPAESIRMMAWGDSRAPMAGTGKDPQAAARRVEISG
jgi:outer membrane protein OmpA-like peptidoglycan-associated protein